MQIRVPFELKALKNREIEGLGSTFGNVDLGDDVMMPGAFEESLAEHRRAGTAPLMFWQHRHDKVPGKWNSVEETDEGLAVKGVLAKTPLGDEVRELAKLQAVRGLSIGGYIRDSDYTREGVRLIRNLELVEVSIVSLAMNPLAQITHAKARLSSKGEYVPTVREFEKGLRDAGYSRTVAKRLIRVVYDEKRDAPPRDADAERSIENILDLCAELTETEQIATIRTLTRV